MIESLDKHLSKETGFIQFGEVIPLFENLCFVLALFKTHQKEYVEQGKVLLSRLLPFQSEWGFPRFIHQFPNGSKMPFELPLSKIAEYERVIEEPLKSKLKKALERLPEPQPLAACPEHFDPALGVSICMTGKYEKGIPALTLGDLAAGREVAGHSLNFYKPLLSEAKAPHETDHPFLVGNEEHKCRYLWKEGEKIFSFVCLDPHPFDEMTFTLPDQLPDEKKEMELNFYVSLGCQIWINGEKGNTFALGDLIEIETASNRFGFRLESDDGQFFGHLLRGNRPNEIGQEGWEVYDYRIALRTVKRVPNAKIRLVLENRLPLPWHAFHCPHTAQSQ